MRDIGGDINCIVCPYGHSEVLLLCGKVPPTTPGLALYFTPVATSSRRALRLTLATIVLSVTDRGSQSSGQIEHDRCICCIRLPCTKDAPAQALGAHP
ncbi:hypothetical protein M405DRAFT_211202 [Rhizopogon salebrosus TDB-379]|nr:hypothetical protein M405DRAFT_211202 [Rhizopogon salebrosus TDB-379]